MPPQESLETSFEGIRYFSACQHVKLKTNAHFQDLAPLFCKTGTQLSGSAGQAPCDLLPIFSGQPGTTFL